MKLLLLLTSLLYYTTCTAQDTLSVYFDNGSYTLNTNAKNILDSIAYNNILQQGKLYTITGYADIVGGEAANTTLSINRARAVAAYVTSFGIKADTTYGRGEIARTDNTNGYPQDRRVDIVAKKESKIPDIKTLKKGDVFDLENMFFHGGMAVMKEESKPVLDMLLTIMQDNKTLKIRIEGHVHCFDRSITQYAENTWDKMAKEYVNSGRMDKHALELSRARAKVVRDYLVKNNIDSTRLQYAGLACKEMELHPDNNRRVAIRILEN